MNKNYYAVVMAGGVGSRFWPLSTSENPKQFHDMLGSGQTLIQKTVQRLSKFIPTENILILTNQRYLSLVLEQLPMLNEDQVVLEPAMRNTAPCILYAALKIQKINPDATMIVAPSDHWIEDEAAFEEDVKQCFSRCQEENALCTLGIKPTFPNTGFGYIEFDKQGEGSGLKSVVQFREKPDYETAKSFLEQGNFLWNAGIFMWGVETIISAFKNHQPETYSLFKKGQELYNTDKEAGFIEEYYPKADNISIDYAILEKSDKIYVLPAAFDWNDLGTWGSLYDKMHDNAGDNAIVNGTLLTENASGNMIRTEEGKLVVLDGINDYIIVDKKEVLLIYPKQKEQHIKEVVAKVKSTFGDQYI
ncbi:MAG: mannose-1-phosphate guanylyltransferase [Flavobacteriaceae bacterium]|nr:mannose-1-phosphate guanylyltransferase [Flavobacteriaceae bacterium]